MAKFSNSTRKTISVAFMVTGASLAIWGYQKSRGLGSQLSNAFTGSHSDNVIMLYIGGAACLVVGIYLFLKK